MLDVHAPLFNIYNDDGTLDPEGLELADDQSALAQAVKEARVLAADTVAKRHFTRHHGIEVTNDAHRVIGAVTFEAAVEIRD